MPPALRAALLLVLLPLILLLSLLAIQAHWFYFLLVNALLLLTGLVLLKPAAGMNLLLFTAPVTSFVCYAAFKEQWNFITGMNYIDAFSVSMPLILLTWLGLTLNRWGRFMKEFGRNPLGFPILVLTIYAGLTVCWSESWQHSLFQFLILLTNVQLYFILTALISDAAKLRLALWLWSLSIAFQGAFALASFFFDYQLISKEILPGLVTGFHFFASWLQPSGWPQVASGLQDNHETSVLMNMTCPVLLGLLLTSKSKRQNVLLFGLLFLLMFVTLRTESRAGFGALLIVGVTMFFLLNRLRRWLFRWLVVFSLLIITIYTAQNIAVSLIIQKNFSPRLFSLGIKVVESGDAIDPEIDNKQHSRRRLWLKSFRAYSEVPLQGLGIGNLKREMRAPHAHSIYFSVWFEFGLIGLLFMLWLTLYLLRGIVPALLRQKTPLEILVSAMSGGVLVICIQGLVDFEYNTTTLWVYLALMTAAVNELRKEQAAAAQEEGCGNICGSLVMVMKE
ncbi:hypothetical protein GCAAIG_02190 [Candidatus Electronema halotolerans]